MRFAIVGSGAVGGYFGAKLARKGQDVTFIARGAHLAAMRRDGLRIQSAKLGDFVVHAPAHDDPAQVGPVDVVLFTVKAYDNAEALTLLPPLMGPDSVVLTLQNGIDSVDDVAAAVGESRVLGGTTYVATALESPGLIVQTGVHRSIIFGEAFGDRSAHLAIASRRIAESDGAGRHSGHAGRRRPRSRSGTSSCTSRRFPVSPAPPACRLAVSGATRTSRRCSTPPRARSPHWRAPRA